MYAYIYSKRVNNTDTYFVDGSQLISKDDHSNGW